MYFPYKVLLSSGLTCCTSHQPIYLKIRSYQIGISIKTLQAVNILVWTVLECRGIRMCFQSKMTCQYCNTTFQTQEELQLHIINIILGTQHQTTFCMLMYSEKLLQDLIYTWDI